MSSFFIVERGFSKKSNWLNSCISFFKSIYGERDGDLVKTIKTVSTLKQWKIGQNPKSRF